MSNLEIQEPTGIENEFLVLETSYQLGGTNYSTGRSEKRGIYLHFTTKTIERKDGYSTSRFSLYGDGNCKVFVKELKRKSQKQLQLFHDYLYSNKDKFINAFKNDQQVIFDLIKEYNKG